MAELAEIHFSPKEEEDDAELMRKISGGDNRAFEKLVQRHLANAVRLAGRILGSSAEAEDVAQESFLRVWKHAPDWKSPDEAGARFSTWFYRIVLNLCIDHKRKRRFSSLDEIPEPLDGRDDAETGLQRREQSERVRKSVSALPERQRAALVLCFYEERSNKDAAEIMGISVKAVESLLVRARKALHDDLLSARQS